MDIPAPHRLAALSGAAGIAGVIAGLALDDFPNAGYSSARVVAWFSAHGTTRWFVSGSCIALGGALLMVFAATLATLVDRQGDQRPPVASRLVPLAATAWAVLTMLGGALWLTVPMALKMFEATPSHQLVLLSGPAYSTLVSVCAVAAAALAAALTTVSRHTGLLPSWLQRLGYPAAVLMLTNVLLPMAVITLWYVAVSVSLFRRTGRATVPGVVTGTPVGVAG